MMPNPSIMLTAGTAGTPGLVLVQGEMGGATVAHAAALACTARMRFCRSAGRFSTHDAASDETAAAAVAAKQSCRQQPLIARRRCRAVLALAAAWAGGDERACLACAEQWC